MRMLPTCGPLPWTTSSLYSCRTTSASQRAACLARAICSSCVPRSSGRNRALPPNATTASFLGSATLQLLALERHGHAARAAPSTRQLVAGHLNRVLGISPRLQFRASEEKVILIDDVIPVRGQLLGRADVALVTKNDPWRKREGVSAVGPLLALLIDRASAAAVDRLEIEPPFFQRAEERLLRRVRDPLLRQIDRRDRRGLTSAGQDHGRIDEAFGAAGEREDGVEVHERALAWQLDNDDRLHRATGVAQSRCKLANAGAVGALGHADEQEIPRGNQDVAPFDRRNAAVIELFARHEIRPAA